MARRKLATWVRGPAAELAAFVKSRPQKKKSKLTKAKILKFVNQVDAKMAAQDWEGYSPSLVVALYMWCHKEVYGVEQLELQSPAVFEKARMQAARQRKEHFENDVEKQLLFMRWVWRRERGYEEWRRNNGGVGKTIHWYRQFVSAEMVMAYRIDEARKNGDG